MLDYSSEYGWEKEPYISCGLVCFKDILLHHYAKLAGLLNYSKV